MREWELAAGKGRRRPIRRIPRQRHWFLTWATPRAHPRATDGRAAARVARATLGDASTVTSVKGTHPARSKIVGIGAATLGNSFARRSDPNRSQRRGDDCQFYGRHERPATLVQKTTAVKRPCRWIGRAWR